MAYILGTATSAKFKVVSIGTTNNEQFRIQWTRFPPAKEGIFYNSLGLYLQRSYVSKAPPVASSNGTIPAYVVSVTTPVTQPDWTTIRHWDASETAALAATITEGPTGNKTFWVAFTDSLTSGTGLLSGKSLYSYRLIYFVQQVSSGDTYEVDYPPAWFTPTGSGGGPGVAVWANNYGGTSYNYSKAVVIDNGAHPSPGQIVMTGTFAGATNFGAGTLTALGGQDMVLARYNPDGGAVWTLRFGNASGSIFPNAIAVASDGSIFVAGTFSGTGNFGGSNHVANGPTGSKNMFVTKYTSAGVFVWDKVFGIAVPYQGGFNPSADYWATGVAVDSNGDIVISGYFNTPYRSNPDTSISGGINFGGGDTFYSVYGNPSICAAKLSGTNGSWIWSNGWRTDGQSRGEWIALDSAGDVYVGGRLSGTMQFPDSTTLFMSNTAFAAVVVKLSGTTGIYVWKTVWGSVSYEAFSFGAAVSGNQLIVTGTYANSSINFGSGVTLSNSHLQNAQAFFVSLLTASGVAQWARGSAGLDNASQVNTGSPGNQVAIDGAGNIYGTGEWHGSGGAMGTLDFSGQQNTSIAIGNTYIVKYSPTGTLAWFKQFTGANTGTFTQPFGLAVDASGPVAVGTMYGTANFSGLNRSQHSSYDATLVRLNP